MAVLLPRCAVPQLALVRRRQITVGELVIFTEIYRHSGLWQLGLQAVRLSADPLLYKSPDSHTVESGETTYNGPVKVSRVDSIAVIHKSPSKMDETGTKYEFIRI